MQAFNKMLCFRLFYFVSIVGSSMVYGQNRAAPSKVYNVVIDAGSSGSRVYVYENTPVDGLENLPEYNELESYKVKPGISQFRASNLDDVKPYLTELVDYAKEKVPENKWSSTSIYLMATAGMRLLLEPRANAVLRQIQVVLADPEVCPFLFDANNARILSGEEEGVFAWITANYLNGYFDDPDEKESTGILELGGASAQIAFIPQGALLANKFPVQIARRNYPLYVHSLLYYGQETAILSIKEQLYRSNQLTNLMNPCMVKGDSVTTNISNVAVTFEGTGDPEGCTQLLDQYVYDALPYRCNPKPCSLGTVYQPTIPADKQFFVLSAYFYTLTTLGVIGEDGLFTPEMTYAAASEFCKKSITVLRDEHPNDAELVGVRCQMGLYIPTLLTQAYGLANDTQQLAAKSEIKGQEAVWCLGAVIYEAQRAVQVRQPTGAGIQNVQGITLLLFLFIMATLLQLDF